MAGRLYIGTSGWMYPSWRSILYPGVPHSRWLAHAARVFTDLACDRDRLQSFLAELARWPEARHALEMRQRSWFTREVAADLHEARRAVAWQAEGRDVHIYFDNDAEGAAVGNARSLLELVRGPRTGAIRPRASLRRARSG